MVQQVYTGRYQIVRQLARGGMAEVYLARDLLLDRQVALKVLFPELAADRSFVERFRREARAAANLNHPGIVAVYDWGEEEGTYFIVMEYVEGRTLRDLILTEGPLHPARAAEIATDIASALAYAHRAGVIHRDVKPGNVIISPSGHVKVTDFGIARAGQPEEALTQTGAVMGTATYFSPEQAQGHPIDARSDVYSLGVVLYEMVAGRPPFVGESPVAVAYQHVRENPPRPSRYNPDVPEALAAVVLKALAKNPENRYPSAEALRADLMRFRQQRPVTAESVLVVDEPTVAVAPARVVEVEEEGTQVAPAAAVPTGPPDRRSTPYVVMLVALLVLLGVLLYFLARELGVGSREATRVQVPMVLGDTEQDAIRKLADLGLEHRTQTVEDQTVAAGRVKESQPAAGASVERGAIVTLIVSSGPPMVAVPAVKGLNADQATSRLEAAGFVVKVNPVPSDRGQPNTVLEQDPPANAQAAKGSTVTLTVSTGPEKVPVPDVSGRDAADAANVLGRAGFSSTTRTEPSDDVNQGAVIRTEPRANTPLAKGSSVVLVVSSGPTTTTTEAPPSTTTSTTFDGGFRL